MIYIEYCDNIIMEKVMAFCSFSSESIISNQTTLDNIFINDYLPYAPEHTVKVYLYGLYKCNNSQSYDNTLENFSKVLGLTEDDIENAFLYWQDQGLVQVLSTRPIEVRYLPIKNAISGVKKFNKTKYEGFTAQAQEIIKGRMITPNEYQEYFTLIESFHFEPEALIMIMQYCTKLKGENVGYAYILSVAKNWAYEKILTCESVEQKLQEFEQNNSEIGELFKTLSIKRKAYIEEMQLFAKWTKELDFDFGVIKHTAKMLKKTKNASFEKIDQKLLAYYEMKLTSIKQIEEYEDKKSELYETAKSVCKAIGVYYENLEPVIDTYIVRWNDMGYDNSTLEKISNYCFKSSIRTLEGVNTTILKLYKLGIISSDSIDEYLSELIEKDSHIKEILSKLGLSKTVSTYDREYYKTWKDVWKISDELIDYAATQACGKSQPMQYLNKLLSIYTDEKITTVEQAKSVTPKEKENKTVKQNFQSREYDKKEINILFDSLEEIDL